MNSPTEKVEFNDFSRPLSDFPVLFKADLIFKYFSSKPTQFNYSRTSMARTVLGTTKISSS